MDPNEKRQTGREYGSGRNPKFDPRDEEKTWDISLDDLLDMDQPFDDDDLDFDIDVNDDYDDELKIEDIEKELDKLDKTID